VILRAFNVTFATTEVTHHGMRCHVHG